MPVFPVATPARAPRIAVCGIHIESSTFTPYISTEADFIVTRGDELMARFHWRDEPWARAVEWIPILHARALPGGVVERRSYEAWKAEILEGLGACGPLDGLFFDIHGAMSVEGMDDAEGDLISAIRGVIGSGPMVSASMDLHGNVSHALFEGCDLLTCYRMAPHEDALESRERAARNLVDRLVAGAPKPVKALVHVPILLPGEKTSTRIEPAKSLYGRIPAIEAKEGILDAAIWIGFAWADQPRCKGAVVVTGDDAALVEAEARELGRAFWDAHDDFEFVAPVATMEECLKYGETAEAPYFISDSGDNPGAGGADDVTVALKALLGWGRSSPRPRTSSTRRSWILRRWPGAGTRESAPRSNSRSGARSTPAIPDRPPFAARCAPSSTIRGAGALRRSDAPDSPSSSPRSGTSTRSSNSSNDSESISRGRMSSS